MKKLYVFTLYADKGASSQYRAYIFKEILKKHFILQWSYFWDNEYVIKYMSNKKEHILSIACKYICSVIQRIKELYFGAPKADIVFIQKGTIPKSPYTFLDRIKKSHRRIVFDVDDAIYLDSKDNSDEIARLADVVICGNNTLKQHYLQCNHNIVVLPTIENTNLYKKYWSDTFHKKSIVWIGSKTTIDNLEIIVNPLNRIIEKHPEVHFYIISNDSKDYLNRIKNTHFISWDKDTYIYELSRATIGIMPLVDNEFNRGKCGFKLIQYLNMKKPVIGTGLGVNNEIIEGNGIIANSEQEWEGAFEELLFNKKAYDECISNIDNSFLKKYNFDTVAKQLVEILDGENRNNG